MTRPALALVTGSRALAGNADDILDALDPAGDGLPGADDTPLEAWAAQGPQDAAGAA